MSHRAMNRLKLELILLMKIILEQVGRNSSENAVKMPIVSPTLLLSQLVPILWLVSSLYSEQALDRSNHFQVYNFVISITLDFDDQLITILKLSKLLVLYLVQLSTVPLPKCHGWFVLNSLQKLVMLFDVLELLFIRI